MNLLCLLFFCLATVSVAFRAQTGATALFRVAHLTKMTPSDSDKAPKLNSYKINTADDYLGLEDRPYLIGSRPDSGFNLAMQNFRKEIGGILTQASSNAFVKGKAKIFPEVLGFTLSNEAVKQAERDREAVGGGTAAHPVSRALYDLGCQFLDRFFDERPIERFWFLETVARIPYFVYVSMLHLYESLGWWREPQLRSIHNAEEWNELHHLLIMENLGGDKRWSDRFLGYHCAILYYWLLIVTYLFSPRIAYQFMELLEAHAVDTYGTFLEQNKDKLVTLPAPDIAVSYYTGEDLYQFDEFMANREAGTRRPPCETLFDVFNNIKDDENEHVATMKACQDYSLVGKIVVSPHQKSVNAKTSNRAEERRKWTDWAGEVNRDLKEVQQTQRKSNGEVLDV